MMLSSDMAGLHFWRGALDVSIPGMVPATSFRKTASILFSI